MDNLEELLEKLTLISLAERAEYRRDTAYGEREASMPVTPPSASAAHKAGVWENLAGRVPGTPSFLPVQQAEQETLYEARAETPAAPELFAEELSRHFERDARRYG